MTPADISRHAKAALRDAARNLATYRQALVSADPEMAARLQEAIAAAEEHARYWQSQVTEPRTRRDVRFHRSSR